MSLSDSLLWTSLGLQLLAAGLFFVGLLYSIIKKNKKGLLFISTALVAEAVASFMVLSSHTIVESQLINRLILAEIIFAIFSLLFWLSYKFKKGT